MNNIVLKIENLSKLYQLGQVGTGTLSHDLNRWFHKVRGKEDPYIKIGQINDRSKKSENDFVWSLRDINFEVEKGEVIGIIGKNGAGKSTLLKIISQITAPTTGIIKAKGRIASLLEVGTGMHPEMTARENIYLNGALLGMKKKEIDYKFDEILDFSGCTMYIDTPIKRFSSGMRVRLGFAVAAFLEPEILIVDEVLAVGDAEFQKKAIGKMKEISSSIGRTVLFVSHNMSSINNLCTKCIILNKGSISNIGETSKIVNEYIKLSDENTSNNGQILWTKENAPGNSIFKLRQLSLLNTEGLISSYFKNTDKIKLVIHYDLHQEVYNLRINLNILTSDEQVLFSSSSHTVENAVKQKGSYIVSVELPDNLFNTNSYKVELQAGQPGIQELLKKDTYLSFDILRVSSTGTNFNINSSGLIAPSLNWKYEVNS